MSHTHLLRNVSLFAQMREEELEALASEFIVQSFRRGQVVFAQGSTTSSLYIVKTGSIQITSFGKENQIKFVNVYGPEEYFGEFALLDGLPRSGEAVSITASDLLVLSRPNFFRFLENHAVTAVKLLVTISRRMRFAELSVDHPMILQPEEKISQLLLDVAERYGVETPDGVRFNVRLASDDLATLCSVTRSAANAAVNALRGEGLITLERSYIMMVDPSRLRARMIKQASTIS